MHDKAILSYHIGNTLALSRSLLLIIIFMISILRQVPSTVMGTHQRFKKMLMGRSLMAMLMGRSLMAEFSDIATLRAA